MFYQVESRANKTDLRKADGVRIELFFTGVLLLLTSRCKTVVIEKDEDCTVWSEHIHSVGEVFS